MVYQFTNLIWRDYNGINIHNVLKTIKLLECYTMRNLLFVSINSNFMRIDIHVMNFRVNPNGFKFANIHKIISLL